MKKEKPLVSVIVPVYNVEKTLSRCIDSILLQTFTNFELILIDDGSRDRSSEICDEYARKDDRLIVIHQPNRGVSSARNKGLDIAQGEYITFCDSDDFVYPTWLQIFIENICNADLCTQSVEFIDPDGNHTLKKLSDMEYNGIQGIREFIVTLINLRCYGYSFTKLFKKNIIEKYDLRFDIMSTFKEDEQFLASYLEHIECIHTTSSVGYCYFFPSTNKIYRGRPYNSFLPVIESHNRIFEGDFPLSLATSYYETVEGIIVSSMIEKNSIPQEFLPYLKIFSYNRKLPIKKRLIFLILLYSPYFKNLSILIIKFIHRLTTNRRCNTK